jgi:hypothetical protein
LNLSNAWTRQLSETTNGHVRFEFFFLIYGVIISSAHRYKLGM